MPMTSTKVTEVRGDDTCSQIQAKSSVSYTRESNLCNLFRTTDHAHILGHLSETVVYASSFFF